MPPVTPEFVYDLETRMRNITVNEYLRMASSRSIWWNKVTRVINSVSRREIITWILNTAQIKPQGLGGNIAFDDMVLLDTEYVPEYSGSGLKLRKAQFEDLDGNGIYLASDWSKQVGVYGAYYPQKSVANLMKAGETAICYDGKALFAKDHPLNPYDSSAGVFGNLFSGSYNADTNPTHYAAPIDDSVTLDVAIKNLSRVYGIIGSIKMPNGDDPRFLRPAGIITGPRLHTRAVQCTGAKFIASTAGSGAAQGGSSDIEALVKALGYGEPIRADEFGGWESDTSYFVVAEQLDGDELGGVAYVDREPYQVKYYTGSGGGVGVDAILDRSQTLEWHITGRNIAAPGHPWVLFKVKGS